MTVEQKHLTYLDELRDSGKTNMFGAVPYIQRKFSLSKDDANKIWEYWMANVDRDGTVLKEAGQ
jgi:hypothetical protein